MPVDRTVIKPASRNSPLLSRSQRQPQRDPSAVAFIQQKATCFTTPIIQDPRSAGPVPTYWRKPATPLNTGQLPLALPVRSPDLWKQLNTHQAALAPKYTGGLTRRQIHCRSYRPLEFMGDAGLKHFVATLLFHRFPHEAVMYYAVSFASVHTHLTRSLTRSRTVLDRLARPQRHNRASRLGVWPSSSSGYWKQFRGSAWPFGVRSRDNGRHV